MLLLRIGHSSLPLHLSGPRFHHASRPANQCHRDTRCGDVHLVTTLEGDSGEMGAGGAGGG